MPHLSHSTAEATIVQKDNLQGVHVQLPLQLTPQWSSLIAVYGFRFQTEGYLFSSAPHLLDPPSSPCSWLCSGPLQFQMEVYVFQVLIVTPTGWGYCGDHQNSLGAGEEPRATPQPYLGMVFQELPGIVAALLKSMVSDSNGFLWELVIWAEKELKEEKSQHTGEDKLVADISKTIETLEDHSKFLKSQIAEGKMTLSISQMNGAMKDALNENSQLQKSHKQLLQEAEVWKEQVSELNKQKISFEDSRLHTEQVIIDKDDHLKTLTEHLLKMKD
ncbi:cTAGE family member 9 [Plecturocebus cupreus]